MWSLMWSWSWSLELEACRWLLHILLASWVLHTPRVGFLKPLLVGSKRTQVGSYTRVGTLISVGAEKDLRRLKSFASRQLIVSNGFYQWIMIDFSIYIWCTLSTWFIHCYYALKINRCYICYIKTDYKKLLGKVRKIRKSVHTLIHPPSQCGCCVQQGSTVGWWGIWPLPHACT